METGGLAGGRLVPLTPVDLKPGSAAEMLHIFPGALSSLDRSSHPEIRVA